MKPIVIGYYRKSFPYILKKTYTEEKYLEKRMHKRQDYIICCWISAQDRSEFSLLTHLKFIKFT